jgi:hypothetical protein
MAPVCASWLGCPLGLHSRLLPWACAIDPRLAVAINAAAASTRDCPGMTTPSARCDCPHELRRQERDDSINVVERDGGRKATVVREAAPL